MKKNTLSVLSQPEVIEELDYDALLKRRLKVLKREAEQHGVDITEITELRTDPGRILLEEASYAEMGVRARQNHVYRSRLLYFAKGVDLDHVAEEYGVTRLENEPDEDLRIRVRIHNRGSSAAGPDDWWRFHAMKADERVEDVAVIRVPYALSAARSRWLQLHRVLSSSALASGCCRRRSILSSRSWKPA